jgi:plastocyanin
MRGLAALLLASTVAACGGGSQQGESNTPPPPTVSPVDPATAGSISGRVAFEGPVPVPQAIRMDSDPNCAGQGSNAADETLVVGRTGALQNVFVYVKDVLGNLRFPVPSAPAVLDQKGCRYVPHVLGTQVGQPVEVRNSDPTLHNVHAIPETNQEFNTGQPIQGMKHTHTFTTTEVMVPFKCDVHGWMRAYIGVLDHPFYAVTDAAGGFALQGLPPGTYTIEAWHESLGRQTQAVTIGTSEAKDVAFTFTPKATT